MSATSGTPTPQEPFQPHEARRFRHAHSVSEAHLQRCLVEWEVKWNTRKTTDGERAALIAKGIVGKRLTYRPTH